MIKESSSNPDLQHALQDLSRRFGPEGGCAPRPGEVAARPDATAWACLALGKNNNASALVRGARDFLTTRQSEDGRVCLLIETPDVYWPTSLAILAWAGSAAHWQARKRAARFLLLNTGRHYPRRPEAPTAHDTALRGWPWVAGTHSWVEPTALAMIALDQCGLSLHERVAEATRMLIDRQIPDGGWNYGNTVIYGTVLDPLPQTTAVALAALAGRVERSTVAQSLSYLLKQAPALHTPLSLGWAILGLDAWGERPARAVTWLLECLGRQDRTGGYDTESLSLLCLAASGSAAWLYGKSGP